MYTTHGMMTPADRADHDALYDTGRHPDCPGHDDDFGSGYLTYCSVNEECPGGDECPLCGGPLASDGVCADDSCGDEDDE